MTLSIIVAVSENQVIGVQNKLPWHLPADLAYFKRLTTGHPILMGRKTFESIGRPLPKRTNIIITKDKQFKSDGIIIVHSIQEALTYCKAQAFDETFIIGGETIYRQMLQECHKVYLTRVHTHIMAGNAFFPVLDHQTWKMMSKEVNYKDEKNEYDYDFELYERIHLTT